MYCAYVRVPRLPCNTPLDLCSRFTLSEFTQFLKFTVRPTFSSFYSIGLTPQQWTVDTWLGAAAVTDILVSAAIVRSLWRSRNGIQRTNNLIKRLIVWTVNTGITTRYVIVIPLKHHPPDQRA